jgi:hypothetical protein
MPPTAVTGGSTSGQFVGQLHPLRAHQGLAQVEVEIALAAAGQSEFAALERNVEDQVEKRRGTASVKGSSPSGLPRARRPGLMVSTASECPEKTRQSAGREVRWCVRYSG